MTAKPLVSVIVPVYNVADYLPRCVESLTHQTYTNLEIILIDDGSTDNSPQLCDAYARQDPRIHVIHQPNQGVCAARNAGLDAMKGEFFIFADSDDWLSLQAVEHYMQAAQATQADLIWSNFTKVYPDGTQKMIDFTQQNRESSSDELLYHNLELSIGNKCYHHKLAKHGLFNTSFKIAEDWVFLCELFARSPKTTFIPQNTYFYFQRQNSASHTRLVKMAQISQTLKTIEYARDICNQHHLTKSAQLLKMYLLHEIVLSAAAIAVYDKKDEFRNLYLSLHDKLANQWKDLFCTPRVPLLSRLFGIPFLVCPLTLAWGCRLPGISALLQYFLNSRLSK